MTSSLEALPSELLSIIATFCVEVDHEDDDSFLRFFLISRTIQAATRQTWLLQYFTHRNVTLSPAKLTELIEVTANAEIARHVKAICVSSNDDSLEFNFEEHGLAPTAKAVKLGLLLGLVLQTLKHLTHVAFRRAETSTNANGNEHTSTLIFPRRIPSLCWPWKHTGCIPSSSLPTNLMTWASRSHSAVQCLSSQAASPI
jgi:hypothetical protein